MSKTKKQKDGNYYEKIVTWKEKPNFWNIFAGIICGLASVFLFFWESSSVLGWMFGFIFFLGIFLIGVGIGKGRKVKFRKIGK